MNDDIEKKMQEIVARSTDPRRSIAEMATYVVYEALKLYRQATDDGLTQEEALRERDEMLTKLSELTKIPQATLTSVFESMREKL